MSLTLYLDSTNNVHTIFKDNSLKMTDFFGTKKPQKETNDKSNLNDTIDTNWTSTIAIKGLPELSTLTLSTSQSNSFKFKIAQPKEIYNIELLKSSLQKAVRRCKADEAVYLAYQILCQDTDQLLRRLPIIILEDVCLHPRFSFLVWCMAAYSKGWQLTNEQIEIILNTVYLIAKCKYRDIIPWKEDKTPFKYSNIKNLSNDIKSNITSIAIRETYGGMQGDKNMLKLFVNIWNKRYQTNSSFWDEEREKWYSDIPPLSIDLSDLISNPPILRDTDKLKEGIDFHCFRDLITKVQIKFKGITDDEIKQAVWHHRSGLNLKQPVCLEDEPYKPTYPDKIEYEETRKKETEIIWNKIQVEWERICSSHYWKAKVNYPNPPPKRTKISDTQSIANFFHKKT